MKKRTANFGGLLLILLGVLALLDGTLWPLLGWRFGIWHMWPLLVGAVGLSFIAAPILFPKERSLNWLFIPGFPVLVTSSLLFLGSVFRIWGIWEFLWPLVILGLAVGFLVTAVFVRNIWLMIPAIIVGVNGLIFLFCAITGLWEWWAFLWTLEPLAVGLALLVASGGTHPRLIKAGLILCVVAVGFFSMMSFVLSGWMSVVGAVLLIVAGAGLIAHGRTSLVLKEKSPDEKLVDGYI
ncbi:MAG: hypothetical protein KC449_21030 [Anaerolineales bacterium]|nr:hypothetical protein [Anaerolineales bacterium]